MRINICTKFYNGIAFIAGVTLAIEIRQGCGPTLKEFKAKLTEDDATCKKIKALRSEVEEFAVKFALPGFEDW